MKHPLLLRIAGYTESAVDKCYHEMRNVAYSKQGTWTMPVSTPIHGSYVLNQSPIFVHLVDEIFVIEEFIAMLLRLARRFDFALQFEPNVVPVRLFPAFSLSC